MRILESIVSALFAAALPLLAAGGCSGPYRTAYYQATGFTPGRQDAEGVNFFGSSSDLQSGIAVETVEEIPPGNPVPYGSLFPGLDLSYQPAGIESFRVLPELRYLLHAEEGNEIYYETTLGLGVEITGYNTSSGIGIAVNGLETIAFTQRDFSMDAGLYTTWTHTLDFSSLKPLLLTAFMEFRTNNSLAVDFIWGVGVRWNQPD